MSDSFHDEEPARLYRDAPKSEPPPALDAAILAAARREVGAGPRRDMAPPHPPFFRQWRVPLSVASVVVISASLVFLVERERPVESDYGVLPSQPAAPQPAIRAREFTDAKEATVTPAPVPAPPAPPVAGSGTELRQRRAEPAKPKSARPEPPAMRSAPEQGDGAGKAIEIRENAGTSAGKLESSVSNQPPAMRQSAPPAATPRVQVLQQAAPAPAVRPAPASKPEVSGQAYKLRRDGIGSATATVGIRGAAGGAEDSREIGAAAKAGPVPDSPEAWLARIEALRRDGKVEEADRSLAEFRKRYPDYPLPAQFKAP